MIPCVPLQSHTAGPTGPALTVYREGKLRRTNANRPTVFLSLVTAFEGCLPTGKTRFVGGADFGVVKTATGGWGPGPRDSLAPSKLASQQWFGAGGAAWIGIRWC